MWLTQLQLQLLVVLTWRAACVAQTASSRMQRVLRHSCVQPRAVLQEQMQMLHQLISCCFAVLCACGQWTVWLTTK
jgi:hypothetical protein